MLNYDYSFLNQKYTHKLWQRLGIKRRAGIMCPLFSIYSSKSIGIGEFDDLKYIIDWCKETGNTILQLLPLNEAGYGNSPYSAHSSFALDPVYIRLDDIIGKTIDISSDTNELRKNFPTNTKHVNYAIREEKLKLLHKIFESADLKIDAYKNFKEENGYWLEDYVEYKYRSFASSAKRSFAQDDASSCHSEQSEESLQKERSLTSVRDDIISVRDDKEFHKWLQWQLFEQLKSVTEYARSKNIKIMGDIPFLVARDSADVEGRYKNVFNLKEIAGCPPDAYNSLGQKWGMPGYNWKELKKTNYEYFKQKLKYAENFFDMYRIDHVVGMFRLWTISEDEPDENGGLNGKFDPEDESTWKDNGESILKAMIDSSSMLPCAEDLGIIPPVCTDTLEKLGIIGIDVGRWLKHRDNEPREFYKPEEFRLLSCAISSGHDMSNTAAMYVHEFNSTDEWCFKKNCYDKGINFDKIAPKLFDLDNSNFGRLKWKDDVENLDIFLWNLGRPKDEVYDLIDTFNETHNEDKLLLINNINYTETDLKQKDTREIVYDILKYTSEAASIFCIHSVLDFMILEDKNLTDFWGFRINFPGSVGDHNWSLRIPYKAEELYKLNINEKILKLNKETERI